MKDNERKSASIKDYGGFCAGVTKEVDMATERLDVERCAEIQRQQHYTKT